MSHSCQLLNEYLVLYTKRCCESYYDMMWIKVSNEIRFQYSNVGVVLRVALTLCSESHAPVPQLVAPDVASEVAHGRAASTRPRG